MNYTDLEDTCRKHNIPCEKDKPLAPLTTMKIGGACDRLVTVTDEESLLSAVNCCRSSGIPFFILGRGSNLLVSSAGYRGCVVYLAQGEAPLSVCGNTITAWAGASLQRICLAARDSALAGLEFAYGIPGSAGGALYMNAGAYGGEMKDVVRSCRCINENGEICEMSAGDMELSYRSSIFSKKNLVITSVTLELTHGDKDEISAKMEELMQRRREKQPLNYPSCGSTFKRPAGYFAAALIEECGLKGCTVGGAQVSEKHSGFVINRSSATFEDVMSLVSSIKRTVKEKTGVELECEMKILE